MHPHSCLHEVRSQTRWRQLQSKRCGSDSIDCWLGVYADLLPLDAQALHAVFLVGEDLSGKR
jgi:hypothetical protein